MDPASRCSRAQAVCPCAVLPTQANPCTAWVVIFEWRQSEGTHHLSCAVLVCRRHMAAITRLRALGDRHAWQRAWDGAPFANVAPGVNSSRQPCICITCFLRGRAKRPRPCSAGLDDCCDSRASSGSSSRNREPRAHSSCLNSGKFRVKSCVSSIARGMDQMDSSTGSGITAAVVCTAARKEHNGNWQRTLSPQCWPPLPDPVWPRE